MYLSPLKGFCKNIEPHSWFIINNDWHGEAVVLHTLDEAHPVDEVHLAGEGAVPGVAQHSQLEAVRSLESDEGQVSDVMWCDVM